MGKEIIYHSGNVLSQDVDRILSVIETKLEGENKNIVKKILFLSVESLQNIIHHSDKNTKGETLSYFELNVGFPPFVNVKKYSIAFDK